jgi:hypothetical protein
MILTALHLGACIALVTAAVHWTRASGDGPVYHRMLPFTMVVGLLGLLSLCGYLIELAVADYSGAIYETAAPTRRQLAASIFPITLTLLPLAGLIPSVGSRPFRMIVIGSLAALPGVLLLG